MRVRVLDDVAQELREATHWYETQQPELGHEFLEAVAESLAIVTAQPQSFPRLEIRRKNREVRRYMMSRFPFLIIYEPREDELVLLAIAHASRRPNYWRNRLH